MILATTIFVTIVIIVTIVAMNIDRKRKDFGVPLAPCALHLSTAKGGP